MHFNLLHVLEKQTRMLHHLENSIIGIVWPFYFVVFSELTEAP